MYVEGAHEPKENLNALGQRLYVKPFCETWNVLIFQLCIALGSPHV